MKALLVLLIVTAACARERNVITGRVAGLDKGDRIILSVESPGGATWVAVDSTVVTVAGEFTLETRAGDCNARLTLLKPGERFRPASTGESPERFLEGHADLRVSGRADEWFFIAMTGGLYDRPDMAEFNRLFGEALELQNEGRKTRELFRATNDSAALEKADGYVNRSNELYARAYATGKEFVKNNPDAAFSAHLLHYDVDLVWNIDEYERRYLSLSKRVQETLAGKIAGTHVANTRASGVGAPAPDFTVEALDGQEITLSRFKGRHVLLDFWNSGCASSRASHPVLLALHDDLKARGLDVVFISVACTEPDDDAWIKAVEEDRLPWIHLNDARSPAGHSIKKQYGIRATPWSVLVSPAGEILYTTHPLVLVPAARKTFGI
ncbi:MAG: TlpA family protein disulfide reductase [Odoribacteraceae bacterium]|jgi:peroxiredoxin|nr:TlpA family protein disulfide reductase [Odoribacteraceae bacterium]